MRAFATLAGGQEEHLGGIGRRALVGVEETTLQCLANAGLAFATWLARWEGMLRNL